MKKLYVMVGVPGSGKSTWISNQDWHKDCVIVSTDYYIDKLARRKNISYKTAFDLFMPKAVNLMIKKVIKARNEGKDIIWDQTSVTIASRRKKLKMLPNYHSIAVVMKIRDRDILMDRISTRNGKEIPLHVLDDMLELYELPNVVEGFNEIWNAE